MKFDPSQVEARKFPTLIPGEGSFEVVDAEETKSKSTGDDMIRLSLRVWDCEGSAGRIFDYATMPKTLWKLKQLLEAAGKHTMFASGDINAIDLIGMCGKCMLAIEDKNDGYGAKAKIKYYIANQGAVEPAPEKKASSNELPDFDAEEDLQF